MLYNAEPLLPVVTASLPVSNIFCGAFIPADIGRRISNINLKIMKLIRTFAEVYKDRAK